MSSIFSPLARAVLNSFTEGLVIFDAEGQVVYTNDQARVALEQINGSGGNRADSLLPELARLGARVAPLRVGGLSVGQAAYLPGDARRESTLAERERKAILDTLEGTGWRLADSAKKLGISRTTLWRRLKDYGLSRDGRGRWSQAS